MCGVIQTGDAAEPWGLQVLAGILVLVAFVLACAGIYLVGRAAWPLYRGDPEPGDASSVERASSQLTRGLLMTFLSVAALALATATSWWPREEEGGGGERAQVQLQTSDGRTACGELTASSQPGTVRVVTDSQPVVVGLDSLASVVPAADGC